MAWTHWILSYHDEIDLTVDLAMHSDAPTRPRHAFRVVGIKAKFAVYAPFVGQLQTRCNEVPRFFESSHGMAMVHAAR